MQLLGEKMAAKQRYELGTELELALSADEGVRIVCAQNPFRLEEVLICWVPGSRPVADQLTVHLMLDHREGVRAATGLRESKGYFIQVGCSSAAAIASWNVEADKALIRFCVATDSSEVKRRYRELLGRGHFACRLRDRRALTAPPATTSWKRIPISA